MAMRNHLLKNPEAILLVFDELRSDFSASSDSENDILVEDSVISEANSTDTEQKLEECSKMLLVAWNNKNN